MEQNELCTSCQRGPKSRCPATEEGCESLYLKGMPRTPGTCTPVPTEIIDMLKHEPMPERAGSSWREIEEAD